MQYCGIFAMTTTDQNKACTLKKSQIMRSRAQVGEGAVYKYQTLQLMPRRRHPS
jgi:hypothetical protein